MNQWGPPTRRNDLENQTYSQKGPRLLYQWIDQGKGNHIVWYYKGPSAACEAGPLFLSGMQRQVEFWKGSLKLDWANWGAWKWELLDLSYDVGRTRRGAPSDLDEQEGVFAIEVNRCAVCMWKGIQNMVFSQECKYEYRNLYSSHWRIPMLEMGFVKYRSQ